MACSPGNTGGAPADVTAFDLVWVNGTLYGLNGTTLYAIDATTAAVTTQQVSGLKAYYGAGSVDSGGALRFLNLAKGRWVSVSGYGSGSAAGTIDQKVPVVAKEKAYDGADCRSS